ncbi:hypothetical protein AB1Y20_000072 [Prymnesium parvum]|uniref:RWD domain-containing protein n=1 Tax=Prymnesium parvum TaxID=97485 RepID=A0AB34K7H0_PRYPA|mmetsp:Transcript_35813/g.89118  ORF Transcript_35813/g.89118 Transcript_35813/m.89118 type:complete len:278 (+) Transcript_35813:23-856(+)
MAEEEAAAKKALQAEVVAVKTRWGDEIKLTKAKPDAPSAPLPVSVTRLISRPAFASAYNVDELKVKLWIEALDVARLPVRVEASALVPLKLQERIAAHVLERWQQELRARGSGAGWMLEKILAWCEAAFVELLTLEPTFIEMYDGCDDNGMTIRRFTIAEPPEPKEEAEEEESEEESEEEEPQREFTEEEIEKMRQLRIKEAAEAEADRQWREERRREAEKLGEEGRQQGISKKEQQKQKEEKNKQGTRLRKQGAKSNKFDAEAAGKKANKKNGLLH